MSRNELLHPRDNINRLYAMRRKEVKDSLESAQQSKQRIIMAITILAKESTFWKYLKLENKNEMNSNSVYNSKKQK